MILNSRYPAGLALVSILLFTGCRVIRPEKPSESYLPVQVVPKTSVVSIPVEMDVKAVEKLLNKQLSGLLYEDSSLADNGGDNLMLKAWKKDDIVLDYDGGQFIYKLPLKLWIKAGFRIEKFGITLSDYREINAEIALKLRTRFTLNEDWTISTTTTSDGYEWLSTPVLRIGPVNLPVTAIANILLKTNKSLIGSRIDKGIRETLPLRKYARQLWLEIQKPYRLSDSLNLWLHLSPQEVYTTGMSARNGKIIQSIGVKSVAEVFLGEMPRVKTDTSLPALQVVRKLDEGFSINLMTDIPFTVADGLARSYLKGKTFTSGKHSITILDINLFGSNGNLAAEAAVQGSISGNLYFTGKPYYDASDSTVKVKDFDFDMKTRNLLLKTANWVSHSGMAGLIGSKLEFPAGERLKESKELVSGNLRQKKVMDNLIIDGRIDRMEVDTLYLSKESIRIGMLFTGKLAVKLVK